MASGKEKVRVAGTKEWTKYGSGFIGDLSKEQKENLAEFLKRVPDDLIAELKCSHETDESFATRWLRARKYDVDLAVEMVTASAKWRKTREGGDPRKLASMEIDEILGCPVEELRRFYPNAYCPILDKAWRPVYIERTGRLDIDALLCSTDSERLLNWHLACQEGFNAKRCALATRQRGDGKVTDSNTFILDLEGFTMSQLNSVTRAYLSAAASVDSNNYPETMGKLLIINAPSLFTMAWSIIQGLLDERTVSKIQVVGEDYRKELFELLGGEDNVPEEYGGKLRIPGGLFSNHNVIDAEVHSGKKLEVRTAIKKGQNYRLRWIARPTDIEAGVKFVGASGKEVVVKKKCAEEECGSHVVEVTHEAPEDGEYVALWDNSAGWTQRVVHYSAVVLEDFLQARQSMRREIAAMPWAGPEGRFEPDVVIAEGAHRLSTESREKAAGDAEADEAAAGGGGGGGGTA